MALLVKSLALGLCGVLIKSHRSNSNCEFIISKQSALSVGPYVETFRSPPDKVVLPNVEANCAELVQLQSKPFSFRVNYIICSYIYTDFLKGVANSIVHPRVPVIKNLMYHYK